MSSDDVRARKLQPIYHALDARNYKAALKLCAKKDLERWDIVKTLKAHALERLGRSEEALDLCREVKARQPTDEVVLSTLVLTFKATGQTREAAECYEAALEQQPGNEEHAKELFACYVRQRAYAKAQQLATRLYKQQAEPQCLFWAATCMQLQAPGMAPAMGGRMLELAERMAEKALAQRCGATAAPSAEELELYVGLLEAQGQHEKALLVLREWGGRDASSVAKGIVDERSVERQNILPMPARDREDREGKLLLHLGRWAEAAALFQRRLQGNPDQWADWTSLLDASFKLAATEPVEASPEVLAAHALMRAQQQQQQALRAPFLAEMELLVRLAAAAAASSSDEEDEAALDRAVSLPSSSSEGGGSSSSTGGSSPIGARLGEALLAYVGRFGTKLCCFDDLLPYATRLAASAQWSKPVVQGLEALASENSVGGRSDAELQEEEGEGGRAAVVRRLQLFIRTQLLLRLMRTGPAAAASAAGTSSVEALRSRVCALSPEYARTLFVNEEAAGGQREVQQGDELLLLAAHLLEDVAASTGGGGDAKAAVVARLEAAALLEQGLRYSPYNYHFRLALLAVHARLGAGAPAVGEYNALDTKQIQYDTLSWLLYPPCLNTGLYTEARARCRQLLLFHAAAARDAEEHVARALRYGTYAKAAEIDRFQRVRMDRSLQLALAKAEDVRLELLQRHHSPAAALTYLREVASGMLPESLEWSLEEMDLATLSDNMDHLIVRDWRYSTRAQREAARRRQGQRHVARLRLHYLLQRALLAALQGEGAQVQERLPQVKAALAELGYVRAGKGSSGNGEGDGTVEAPQLRHRGWELAALCLDALALALPGAAAAEGTGAVEAAVRVMEAAATCAAGLQDALLSDPAAQRLDRVLGAAAAGAPGSGSSQSVGLLDPAWLAAVSAVVGVVGAAACPILGKLGAALLAAPGGKRKAKKGGKAGESQPTAEQQSGDKEKERLAAAARALLQKAVALLSGVEGALDAFRGEEAEPAEALVARELGPGALLTFVGEEDFADLRVNLVGKVRASHRLSAERIVEVLREKVGVLKAYL